MSFNSPVQIRARLVVGGVLSGSEMIFDVPELPDPRIERYELQILALSHENQLLKFDIQRLTRRTFWQKLLGKR